MPPTGRSAYLAPSVPYCHSMTRDFPGHFVLGSLIYSEAADPESQGMIENTDESFAPLCFVLVDRKPGLRINAQVLNSVNSKTFKQCVKD